MANEDWDEAVRRIEEVRESGGTRLDLIGLKIDSLPPEIAGLTALQTLDLRSTQITDDDLAHIAGLTALQTLFLDGTQITDTGLPHIAGLTALQSLYLGSTQITDTGLPHIASLTALQTLDLDGTRITDAGLPHIAGLTALQTLYLGSTQIADTGLPHIAGLTALQTLDLAGTQITDTGLPHIAGLTVLKSLSLGSTQITDPRPLLNLPLLTKGPWHGPNRLSLHNTPALNGPVIAAAMAHKGYEDQRKALLAHLRSLPPWPEPLPVNLQAAPATGAVPKPPPTDGLPTFILTDDHRIDLLPLAPPPGTGMEERLYARLKNALEKLKRHMNQYDGLADVVRSFEASLGDTLADVSYLDLHFDLSDLTDLVASQSASDTPWDRDATNAAQGVLRAGPGLTIPHPDIKAHEDALAAFERKSSAPANFAEKRVACDLAESPELMTDASRALVARAGRVAEDGRGADLRSVIVRKAVVLLSITSDDLIGYAKGVGIGWVLLHASFLWSHAADVMAMAQFWGPSGKEWAEHILRVARDILEEDRKKRDGS